jgi:hypothetical protein
MEFAPEKHRHKEAQKEQSQRSHFVLLVLLCGKCNFILW